VSTACARILKARLRLRLATTDSKAHHSVLSYTLSRTIRDAARSEDDGLYEATIDGGGLECGDEVVPAACPYPVLASEDWMMRNPGEGDGGRERMWRRMMVIAKSCLRRIATSYCVIGSLAKGQWPPIIDEGVFTRVEAHAEHHGFPP